LVFSVPSACADTEQTPSTDSAISASDQFALRLKRHFSDEADRLFVARATSMYHAANVSVWKVCSIAFYF
jgi:hypothetical protein